MEVAARNAPAPIAATTAAIPMIEGSPPRWARIRTQNQLRCPIATRRAASCSAGGGPETAAPPSASMAEDN